jgi:Fe-S cluster assembly protein SufD
MNMSIAIVKNKEPQFRNRFESEPDWLYEFRREAWDSFRETPLPDRVSHLWRYTKPEHFLPPDAGLNLQLPYRCSRAEIDSDIRERGVILDDLHTAIADGRPEVKSAIGGLIGYDFGKFEALNAALWNNGLFLYIPDHTIIEKPIYLKTVQKDALSISRLLIVVGAYSEATVIDSESGDPSVENMFSNGVIETYVGESSNLRYVHVQNFPIDATSYLTHRSRLGRNASGYSIFAMMGSGISKYDVGTILDGRGAESRLDGLYFGEAKQHFDLHTVHHHKSVETFSNLDHKVVLKNKADSAYTGLIRIEKDAENCEAYQENRNLLLNRGSKAESIPELEILTDQVRCTHGATMGPIDPEMIFYLNSRGIGYEDAVRAIVYGFMEPTFKQMPEALRSTVVEAVAKKLEGNGYA